MKKLTGTGLFFVLAGCFKEVTVSEIAGRLSFSYESSAVAVWPFKLTILFSALCLLVACGESVPQHKKLSVERQIGIHDQTNDLLEKARLAGHISNIHWDPELAVQWSAKAKQHKSSWRLQNCDVGNIPSQKEELLAELNALPKPHRQNDYGDVTRIYKGLYELCGEQIYADRYGEYSSLLKFASIKKSICNLEIGGTALGDVIQHEFSGYALLTREEARNLGAAASAGYGECQCVLHDYFKVPDNISIGFCIGPDYQDCKDTAYCGATADRAELAKKLDGYEYKFPGVSDPYESFSAPTNLLSAPQALEWGKARTAELVRQFCSGNPDC